MSEPCPDSSRLSLLLDDELAPAEARSLELHLASCAGCRRERDRLARVTALLLAPAGPSSVQWSRLVERARRAPSLSWRALAAAVLLAIAIPGSLAFVQRARASAGGIDPTWPTLSAASEL
jgi:hypothetical protein